jgi:hypothetical protein
MHSYKGMRESENEREREREKERKRERERESRPQGASKCHLEAVKEEEAVNMQVAAVERELLFRLFFIVSFQRSEHASQAPLTLRIYYICYTATKVAV